MSGINPPPPTRLSFGRRLWLVFKKLVLFTLRTIATLVFLAALAAAIYFGGPILIEEYLLRDVRVNQADIQDLQSQFEAHENLVTQHLEQLQGRLDDLEIQSDTHKQSIDDLRSQLSTLDDALQLQASSLEELASLQVAVEELQASVDTLSEQLDDHTATFDDIHAEITSLQEALEVQQSGLETLGADLQSQATLDAVQQQLELLKTMELLTRARLNLAADNLGLAREDLQAAIDGLTALKATLSEEQASYLDAVIQRLEQATANLAENPSLSEQDLEIAWQLLYQGFPQEASPGQAGEANPTP